MKIHPLITKTEELAELCERLAQGDFVCVDTEFMRENTFYPLLCLVQLGNEEEAAAIDPLADGIDLAPMLELFCNNEDVLKVFHAGGQDVEIIYNLTGRTPHPIFDTQIAMMAVSQSEQIGYANLVESWMGKTIDKGARFTDWSRRPLTERQIEYAIGDVTYLAKIFPRLLKKLIKTGRGSWLDAEMEKLADPANYANDLATAWHRIRPPSRSAIVLGRLKALAAWRESEAQAQDIPRGRIMRDETLADLASHPPKTQIELAKVRGLSQAWKDNDIGKRLMKVLAKAEPLPGEVDKETIAIDKHFVACPHGEPLDPPAEVTPAMIDEGRLLLLEDGHCLKDHALAACNRPELRPSATMIGTSLHTLVQMVDNGLGVTMLPEMAIDAGILHETDVVARPLKAPHASREIALIWRKNSPRAEEFRLLAQELKAG